MSDYRVRATGEIKSQGQIRRDNPNVSLPKSWNDNVCDFLGVDPVLNVDFPENNNPLKKYVLDGAVQNDNGDWVQNYVLQDRFADYTADGVTVTKASQEESAIRNKRNLLLAETDFHALSDVTMSAAMTTYRQALRDITSHANFPTLEDADWPTKP